MSSLTPDPVPQRIGDAERDRAAEYLREHLAEGRLTSEEFDDRLSRALTAKTAGDLAPLFADLPSPRPGEMGRTPDWTPTTAAPPGADVAHRPAGLPATDRAAKIMTIISGVSWPVIIMALFATSWTYWWLIFIPIALSSIAGTLSSQNTHKGSQQRGELER